MSTPQIIGSFCHHGREVCSECGVRNISICSSLENDELRELDALTQKVSFEPRAALFAQDQPADSVYNLTEGVVRLYKLLPDGRRQIVGFALPGDFLGLAMAERYGFSADAVDHVHACRFSRDEFANFLDAKPHFLRRLHEYTTHELSLAQDQMVLLGRRTAEEKVATFLVNWRDRWSRLTGKTVTLPLPMSRQDIADFLGLTIETVSRTFSRLGKEKTILIVPDGVRVLDSQKMERLAAA